MIDAAHPPARRPWTEQDYTECSTILNEKRAGLTSYVRKVAPSVDHDNVVGEALLALYKKWDEIGDDKLRWLYRVAYNKAVDALRDKNHGHAQLEEATASAGRAALVGSWTPPAPGERLLFVEAIGVLPRHLGLPLTLFDKGWRVEEIAEYMDLTVATTRVYLSRAKKFYTREIYAREPGKTARPEGTQR